MAGWRRMVSWAICLACLSAMPLRAADTAAERLAAACHDAVVGVYCMRDDYEGYTGTGAVVSADGYILTSTTSVFDGVEEVFVHFPDFRVMKAKVVEINMPLESVLLKVDAQGLASLPVARAIPRVGTRAFSAGNADHLIRLSGEPTFSMGTVSGVYDVQSGDSQSSYAGLAIETTAAVNPGQDGGPLLDAAGRIMGMISLSLAESRWQGTAVPMARILEGMKAFRDGRVRVSDRPLLDDASPDDGRKTMADRVQPWANCLVRLTVEREFQVERLATVHWPAYRKTIPNWESLTAATRMARQADLVGAEMTINANRLVCRPQKMVTGVVISADGYILTSAFNVASDTVFKHRQGQTKPRQYDGSLARLVAFEAAEYETVANPVRSVTATLADGKSCPATIVAQDLQLGVALLKVAEQDLPHLDLKNSHAAPVLGEAVGAVGIAPDGTNGFTLNEGMISAVRRNEGRRFQFTALVNYGNSGGPVINADGRILGLILEPLRAGEGLESMLRVPPFPKSSGLSSGRVFPLMGAGNQPSLVLWQTAPNSGVGFAAPIGRILESLPTLMQGRNLLPAGMHYLGIVPNLDVQQAFKNEVIVHRLEPKSPAAEAGLAVGDRVVQIDGRDVPNWKVLLEILAARKVGDVLSIRVERKAKPAHVEINGIAVRNERDLKKMIESLGGKDEFSGRVIRDEDSTPTFEVTLQEQR
jgi:S1-C subfamily serine protease